MKETKAILEAEKIAASEGQATALVTVVQVEGSSYRRPGARMLVTESGNMTGAISGGCLEGDALRKALLVLHQQEAKIVTYDTSDEEDRSIGVQLGCAGIIQVLMEPVKPHIPTNSIKLLQKITGKRQSAVLVTIFSVEEKNNPQPGTCWLLEVDGTVSGNLPDPEWEQPLLNAARKVLEEKKAALIQLETQGKSWNCFIEFIAPPVSLIIAGAGNDVIPLVGMADILGWESTILDGRPSHANADRFQSSCTIRVTDPGRALDNLTIDNRSAAVLMTHNYQYDKAMLVEFLKTGIPYIGCLGPKKKLERMLDELAEEGYVFSSDQLSTLYGPVGYDIGAETAEEIALSVISEIQGMMACKTGPSLRNKSTPIHLGNPLF